MSFIKEILEVEKDSEKSLQDARQSGQNELEKAENNKRRDLSAFSLEFQGKKEKALEVQNEELESERNKSQKNLEKELEQRKAVASSKKKTAVDYVMSQILH